MLFGAGTGKGKEESSFCEQKEAKKLSPLAAGSPDCRLPKEKKFFASFFQKRRFFLAATCLHLAAPAWAASDVHPLKGQDAAHLARDLRECEAQAAQKSGHDPASGMVSAATKGAVAGAATGALGGGVTSGATSGAATAAMRQRSQAAAYEKERGACLGGRGYRVGG
jgi:hypothetical protein